MTLRLLNTERNHLLHPRPQSPRDAAALSSLLRSPRMSCSGQQSPKPKSAKMAHGGLERSLSFRNWEAASRGGGGINGTRPGTLALQQQSPRRVVSVFPHPHPQAQAMIEYISPRPRVELDQAATTLQKAYKGLRTRRSLADGAIVAEELWWKTVDSVYLNIKSISFFHEDRQETAASRWSRAGKRVAKVGKGLSKDDKAQKLALQHWLEAVSIFIHFIYITINVFVLFVSSSVCLFRLTRATATATTCTSTTTSGARAPAASPSSTGWMSAKAETCITRNAHEASSTHSSSCTSDQYVRCALCP
jgi:hypothetical protein